MPTIAERLARHVTEARYEDLPGLAIVATKTFLLDAIGVGIAGAGTPEAHALREAARLWGDGSEASVLGTGLRLPAANAALVNGHHMHCQEFDCLHEAAVVHAMSVVAPASLAIAERSGTVSGRDLILALALGIDIAVTVGLNPAGAWRFFRPATAGAFGAVAALGKLGGFDAQRLVNAFGLGLGQASGTMQPHAEGKPLLPLQIGFNARNAVMAADLAATGLEGTRKTFEGEHGYLALFEGGWDMQPALDQLGDLWRVTELSHKPFPSGRATHGLADGLLRLKGAHGFSAADVEHVTLRGTPLIAQLVSRPDLPQPAPSYARLCAAYIGAVALLGNDVGLGDFTPARLHDPAIHDLASRISLVSDETLGGGLLPQHITVRLKNGTTHDLVVNEILGSPARPLSRERQLQKFRTCWSTAELPSLNANRLIETVDRLERIDNVSALICLAAAASRKRS